MSKRPLVFLDTETTGLGPQRRAWEIAFVRREVDGTERSKQFFLPVDASYAEPGALNIGRFYERHPQGIAVAGPVHTNISVHVAPLGTPFPQAPTAHCTPAAEVAKILARWTAGATIVGANPSFDTYLLERLLRSQGFEPRWHYRLRDVESMVCAITEPDMGGLTACADAMGVKVDRALEHTAMGDVRTVMAIWDAVVLIGEQIDAVFAPALAKEASEDVPAPGQTGAFVVQTTGLAEGDDPQSGALPSVHGEVIEVTPGILAAAARTKANGAALRRLARR